MELLTASQAKSLSLKHHEEVKLPPVLDRVMAEIKKSCDEGHMSASISNIVEDLYCETRNALQRKLQALGYKVVFGSVTSTVNWDHTQPANDR